jgi:hypothetical protein
MQPLRGVPAGLVPQRRGRGTELGFQSMPALLAGRRSWGRRLRECPPPVACGARLPLYFAQTPAPASPAASAVAYPAGCANWQVGSVRQALCGAA